jgi:hypothetical protein
MKGLVMVGGEDFNWPEVSGETNRRPDNNVAAPFVLRRKIATRSQTRDTFGHHIMAVPATADICTDVRPIEAKVTIGVPGMSASTDGNDGIGELEDYVKMVVAAHERINLARWMKNLAPCAVPVSIPCMLYGKDYYWLLTMEASSCTWSHLTYGKFTERGSVEAISNHFPLLPWENATFGVFTELDKEKIDFVDPLLDHVDGKTGFLGQVCHIIFMSTLAVKSQCVFLCSGR